MIFKRLLGRKKRADTAPEGSGRPDPHRSRDQDAAVRRDACRRIKRLPELRDLASSDADAGVREIALAHYRNLLCGQEDDGRLA